MTCLGNDILDLGCHSCMVCHDDQPPLVVVKRFGFPSATLPTLLNFPRFRAFRGGVPWMI